MNPYRVGRSEEEKNKDCWKDKYQGAAWTSLYYMSVSIQERINLCYPSFHYAITRTPDTLGLYKFMR